MSTIEDALLGAQRKAEDLFVEVVGSGLIRPGVLESELSDEIHAIAVRRYGLRRHWHRRIVRSGPNTLLSGNVEPPDRRLAEDDTAYIDFGPVFNEWEADFGRTFVLGHDVRKHKLVADMEMAFRAGKPELLKIRHGNALRIRDSDPRGNPRHWILEIHFVDRANAFGGFMEELLTI